MDPNEKKAEGEVLSRRDFIQSVAASGVGLMLSQLAFAQGPVTAPTPGAAAKPSAAPSPAGAPAILKPGAADALNVAIIGTGLQGRTLLEACRDIPYLRFKAVCDIWPYSQRYGARWLKKNGHLVNTYEDYREMLAKEKDLHAVIVATPDWLHAEHTIACLEAGLHVYCEKEMSNSLDKARQMVLAARRTGKLLQIGHQRRSNPRYQHAIGTIIERNRILGRVTQANGQWNRARTEDLGWPKTSELDPATLAKYGYGTMHEFRNWRWFKKYGGGPIVDLGSHQIDIFSWVFKNNPRSVMASGGADYYTTHEWFDNVMCIYEFDSPEGPARAFYQVLTTTSNGAYFESFMGLEGTLVISESARKTKLLREPQGPEWDKWVNAGVLKKPARKVEAAPAPAVVVDARESRPPEEWLLPVELSKPYHQPHLENFFEAIRGGAPLTCPAEVGYETAVAVLAVNRAIETGQKILFRPEEFKIS